MNSEVSKITKTLSKYLTDMPAGILILNKEYDVIFANNKAKKILSINEKTTNINNLAQHYEPFKRLILNNNRVLKKKDLFFKVNEKILYLEVFIDKIIDDENFKSITIIDKTSDLKKIDTIKSMQDELSQFKNLAAIGTMISGIAHELNNPISGISMSSQLAECSLNKLIDTIKVKNPDDNKEIMESILYSLEEIGNIKLNTIRSAKLVGSLLNYSRKERLDLQRCNLNDLINETLEITKTQSIFLNSEITVKIEEEIILNCDIHKIQQVVFNIIKNSAESIEKNGKISIICKKENDYAKIAISDNGCGVDPANTNQIFTPFFTTKSNKGGTGLGLSISHRIIERHGGKISLKSSPGRGSEFVVILPLNLE